MNHRSIVTIGLGGLLVLTLLMAGCTGTGDNAPATPAESTQPQSIVITGSTTVLPIAELAAEEYLKTHPNDDLLVSGGGSSVGVQAVGEGTAAIGMASRDLKDAEKEKFPNLIQHVVAKDGIAVIVYPENPVGALTTSQVKSIYLGEITNWQDVGGEDMPIVVVGRDSASGTREFFLESVMNKEDFTQNQLEKNSNGAVKQTVSQTPGAIGYVSMGYIDNTIQPVTIDGVDATIDNVLADTYPIARGLYMLTDGQPTGLAKDYLDFVLSPAGQALVEEEGFVPVN